jgi:SP family sugar:H+ symporter-like MFS transporter
VSNFVISQTFPTLADIGLALAYGIYTAFAVLSFLFVAKFVRETKGRHLEDMA